MKTQGRTSRKNELAGEAALCLAKAVETDLRARVESLKGERRQCRRSQMWIAGSVFALGAIFYGIMHMYWGLGMRLALALALVICAWAVRGLTRRLSQRLQGRLQQSLGEVLVKSAAPDLTYHSTGSLTSADFNRAGVFKNPDRLTGRHLVTGHIGGHAIKYSTILAEEEHQTTVTETDSEGRSHEKTEVSYSTIFEGVMLELDFPCTIQHPVLLRRAQRRRFLDFLFRPKEQVLLENPDFARAFSVTGDQIESRVILTPAFMEQLLEMQAGGFGEFAAAFRPGRETGTSLLYLFAPIDAGDLDLNTRVLDDEQLLLTFLEKQLLLCSVVRRLIRPRITRYRPKDTDKESFGFLPGAS